MLKPNTASAPNVPRSTDRHREGGDQCGANVLQEHEHDDEHERDGFDECLDHFLDGEAHEWRGVERGDGLHSRGKQALQLLERRADAVGGVERIGARGELNRHARRRLPVEARGRVVALAPKLHARDIAQAHDGAAALAAQHDRFELLGPLQAALRTDRRIQLLAGYRRRRTQLPGGDLRVLCLDSGAHIGGGQRVVHQLLRIEPDPHRVLRAEERHAAYAGNAAEPILQVRGDQVRQVGRPEAAVARHDGHDHQEG